MRRVVVLIVAFALTAQTLRAQPGQLRPAVDSIGIAQLRADSITIAVLKAQYALMREYDQRLLSTVYWSLGVVSVLVGLLVGYGWFTNFRIYERDKALLRKETAAGLRDDFAVLKGEIAVQMAAHEVASTKLAKDAAGAVDRRISAVRADLENRILLLELELAENEAEEWRRKQVYTNEVRATIKMIHLASQVGRPFMISSALDRMQVSFRAGAKPDAELAAKLVGTLDRLTTEYGTEVETLKAALRNARNG